MKHRFKKAGRILLSVLLVCALFCGYLYFAGGIGVQKSKLEQDIRSSQKIKDDWTVTGAVSDTMAAYVSCPADQSSHTFSVYVNHPGLSFGYFFRGGGSLSSVEECVAAFTVEGYNEKAYISMNSQHADRLEIDDGNAVQTIALDSGKPFALVLPTNAGTVTFYDMDGKPVEVRTQPL